MLFTHLKEVVRHKKPDRSHFYFHIPEGKKAGSHPYFHLQNQIACPSTYLDFRLLTKPHANHHKILVKIQESISAASGSVFLAKLGRYLKINSDTQHSHKPFFQNSKAFCKGKLVHRGYINKKNCSSFIGWGRRKPLKAAPNATRHSLQEHGSKTSQ